MYCIVLYTMFSFLRDYFEIILFIILDAQIDLLRATHFKNKDKAVDIL